MLAAKQFGERRSCGRGHWEPGFKRWLLESHETDEAKRKMTSLIRRWSLMEKENENGNWERGIRTGSPMCD